MKSPIRNLIIPLILVCFFTGAATAQSINQTALTITISPTNDTSGSMDTSAIQGAITKCNQTNSTPIHRGCTIYLKAPLYVTNIDLTNRFFPGITFIGVGRYDNTASPEPTVTITGSTSRGFDLSGTSGILFKDISFGGDTASPPTATPISAIYAARTSTSNSSFGHTFENVGFYGAFTSAAVYDFAGEGWSFINTTINISSGTGAYFTSSNSLGITSYFVPISTSTPDMTLTSFDKSNISVQGGGAHCLWFEGKVVGGSFPSNTTVESINIRDSYFNASSQGAAPAPGACLQFTDVAGGITFSGNRDESAIAGNANAAFAVMTSSGTNSVLNGIDWRGNQFYSKTNIIDASAGKLNNVGIKNNKSGNGVLTYLLGDIQYGDIGPLTPLEKVKATGNVYGVNIQVGNQALLANISLPINSTALVGNDSQYVVQTSGTSFTVPEYTQRVLINAGGISADSITTPQFPVDGQKLIMSSNSSTTTMALTVISAQTISCAPTTIPIGGTVGMIYVAPLGAWFCSQ